MKALFVLCQFCLSIFLIVGIIGTNVHAEVVENDRLESVNYLHPENRGEVFTETVDEFYQALRERKYPVNQEFYKRNQRLYKGNIHMQNGLDTILFKEIPDASVNIRKKVLFHEVEEFDYITWDANIHYTYPDIDINYHQTISPHRQVYFFFSFKDTEKEFKGRYAVYDVETKKPLAGGGTYIPKYPKYENYLK
ncbi:hypothetical protein [Mesobacillus maritimus]|uniref:hypothetical protein n=1 Tax=Mesobacillus maritimus TaxID=1643336 RepID=UPI00384DAD4A